MSAELCVFLRSFKVFFLDSRICLESHIFELIGNFGVATDIGD
ncbi:hypothetical protein KR51_00021870 [Rubidibacter lacunae KORDI 51-2]|uniref:Uncharacterized protein n=1 Tax=Rubidibacter lacunae KORDI 51-2 TaxID=582515 RepID=U5D9E6_9CHRO|nr:hypothetical protein KR51_00021870 [Rubidibacter lacunae KORDI 51-2]